MIGTDVFEEAVKSGRKQAKDAAERICQVEEP